MSTLGNLSSGGKATKIIIFYPFKYLILLAIKILQSSLASTNTPFRKLQFVGKADCFAQYDFELREHVDHTNILQSVYKKTCPFYFCSFSEQKINFWYCESVSNGQISLVRSPSLKTVPSISFKDHSSETMNKLERL